MSLESTDEVLVDLQPFAAMIVADEPEEPDQIGCKEDSAAAINNPNANDNRRLYQKRVIHFMWDPSTENPSQPNRLEDEGPVSLQFPEHFYECEGSVILLYFEKDRSTACIGSILNVNEEAGSFLFRPYGWQGKTKQT